MSNPRKCQLYLALVTFTCGHLLAGGCSGLVRRSVRDGVFGYLSGNVGDSFGTNQMNAWLADLLTGGFSSEPGVPRTNF